MAEALTAQTTGQRPNPPGVKRSLTPKRAKLNCDKKIFRQTLTGELQECNETKRWKDALGHAAETLTDCGSVGTAHWFSATSLMPSFSLKRETTSLAKLC